MSIVPGQGKALRMPPYSLEEVQDEVTLPGGEYFHGQKWRIEPHVWTGTRPVALDGSSSFFESANLGLPPVVWNVFQAAAYKQYDTVDGYLSNGQALLVPRRHITNYGSMVRRPRAICYDRIGDIINPGLADAVTELYELLDDNDIFAGSVTENNLDTHIQTGSGHTNHGAIQVALPHEGFTEFTDSGGVLTAGLDIDENKVAGGECLFLFHLEAPLAGGELYGDFSNGVYSAQLAYDIALVRRIAPAFDRVKFLLFIGFSQNLESAESSGLNQLVAGATPYVERFDLLGFMDSGANRVVCKNKVMAEIRTFFNL